MFVQERTTGEPMLEGQRIWRVGFHIEIVDAIKWLSGLVTIYDVVWLDQADAILLVVDNEDVTGTLFKKGSLTASHVGAHRIENQPVLVHRSRGWDGPRGVN